MTTPDAKRAPDWALIEAQYRAGISLRQIAKDQGVSHVTVATRGKKEGWARDLNPKIQAKAESLLNTEALNASLNSAEPVKRPTESAVIEANASVVYRVRAGHRAHIARSLALFTTLLGELEAIGTSGDLARDLFEVMHSDDADDAPVTDAQKARVNRMRTTLEAVLSVPGRIDAGKKAIEMLEKLVRLEREAFGIKSDDDGPGDKSKVVWMPKKDAE